MVSFLILICFIMNRFYSKAEESKRMRKQRLLCVVILLAAICVYCKNVSWKMEQEKPELAVNREVVLFDGDEEESPLAENALNSLAACLMDASNGRVLYGKNAEDQRAMASTTKIMTCLLALERCQQNEIVTVSKYAASQPPVQMNIREGERYYLKDLLHSMMMASHNDSAVAVAEHVAGSEEEFCKLMTEKAHAIGAVHTSFGSANGLDRGEHYTTAEDLALIAAYAVKNDALMSIVQCDTYTVREVDGKNSSFLSNINKYLYMDSDALGMKTGFTNKAGYCFVGATGYEDTLLISVALGSGWPPNKNYKWADTKKLVEYGRENFSKELLEVPKQELGAIPVRNGQMTYVNSAIVSSYREILLLGKHEKVTVTYRFTDEVVAPVQVGDTLGVAELHIDEKCYVTIPIMATEYVPDVDYRYYWNLLLGGI